MRRTTLVLLALCCLSAPAAFADDPSPAQIAASKFVQQFYDWYTPLAHKRGNTPSWLVAVTKQAAQFDPALVRALKADADAQKKVSDDIVGMDFDPFLGGQDPQDKYTVGDVAENNGVFLVSVYGERNGKRTQKPDVIAVLKASKGSFQFTNFRFGGNDDLLGTLKLLKDQRAKSPQ